MSVLYIMVSTTDRNDGQGYKNKTHVAKCKLSAIIQDVCLVRIGRAFINPQRADSGVVCYFEVKQQAVVTQSSVHCSSTNSSS